MSKMKYEMELLPHIKSTNPQVDTNELERDIDLLVYDLYGLTQEERDIVEGKA